MASRFSGKEGQIFQIIDSRGGEKIGYFVWRGALGRSISPVPAWVSFGGDNINRVIVIDPAYCHDHLPGAQKDDHPAAEAASNQKIATGQGNKGGLGQAPI